MKFNFLYYFIWLFVFWIRGGGGGKCKNDSWRFVSFVVFRLVCVCYVWIFMKMNIKEENNLVNMYLIECVKK